MFGDPFYNQSLRKTVIAFGSLFNEIYIQRKERAKQRKNRFAWCRPTQARGVPCDVAII